MEVNETDNSISHFPIPSFSTITYIIIETRRKKKSSNESKILQHTTRHQTKESLKTTTNPHPQASPYKSKTTPTLNASSYQREAHPRHHRSPIIRIMASRKANSKFRSESVRPQGCSFGIDWRPAPAPHRGAGAPRPAPPRLRPRPTSLVFGLRLRVVCPFRVGSSIWC